MTHRWSQRAFDDLRTKVKNKDAQKYLLRVARSSLHQHCPEWGGSVPGRRGLRLWRRGVTVDDEALSDDQLSIAQSEARRHTLIYFRSAEYSCYMITGLLTEGEMIAGSPWFR